MLTATPSNPIDDGADELRITTGDITLCQQDGSPLRLAYREIGDRRAPLHLLLLHGLFDDSRTWQRLLPQLARIDRYIVAIDLLGFGRSSRPRLCHLPANQRYSLDMHADIMRQLVAKLQMQNLVLVGNSLGGSIVLRALCTTWPAAPSIRGLVLESAAGYPQPLPISLQCLQRWPGRLLQTSPARWLLRRSGAAEWLARRSLGRAFYAARCVPEDLRQRSLEMMGHADSVYACRETVRHMIPADIDQFPERYRQIVCPTLVLWGRNDRIISPLYAQRFAIDIRDAKLHLFDACGHAPHLERPVETAAVINTWLEQKQREST